MWWVRARQEATHNEASDMEWWGKGDWNSGICYLEYLFDFCMGVWWSTTTRDNITLVLLILRVLLRVHPAVLDLAVQRGRLLAGEGVLGVVTHQGLLVKHRPVPAEETPPGVSSNVYICSFLKPRLHLIPYPISEREIVHFKPALLKALKDPSS